MSEVTKQWVEDLIKDTLGDALTEARKELQVKATENAIEPKPQDLEVKQEKAGVLKGYSYDDTDDQSPEALGRKAARSMRYMILAGKNPEAAKDLAFRAGDHSVADAMDKAMGTGTLSGGGSLVPVEFSMGIIQELNARATIRKCNPTIMPMNTGSLVVPYLDSGATAAYVTENSNISSDDPTTGQLQLFDHTLASIVPVSNQLLRNGGQSADNAIKNNMIAKMGAKEDVTFIRSAGTSGEPMGMLYQVDSSNKFDATATTSVANTAADLGKMIYLLEENNIPIEMDNWFWVFSPRTKQYLANATDSNGNYVWRDEMKTGRLLGFRFHATSQIPRNLGSGTDESEVYLCYGPGLVIAENEMLEINVFDGGAYYDGSAVQSGVSRNQTVIRALASHDFGCQYRGKEISVLEAVTWPS